MADDNFKHFDHQSILPDITIRDYTFKAREVILAGCGVIFIITSIVFIALYAGATPNQSNQQNSCLTTSCLESSTLALFYMNKTLDPCDDFYKYACYNYKKVRTLKPDETQSTLFIDVRLRNQEKLRELIETPPARGGDWASEKKLKDMFDSCQDHYIKMKLAGKPFIDKMIKPSGGWFVLGADSGYTTNSFNFMTQLMKVHVDYWGSAFFSFRLGSDTDFTKRVIVLYQAGVGMWQNYFVKDGYDKIRNDYKNFMTNVAKLLVRDSGIVISDTTTKMRIDTFVADVMEVETMVAQAMIDSKPNSNPFSSEQRVAIGDMNTRINNEINFVQYFKYMFDGAGMDENTKIVLQQKDYIDKLGTGLGALGTNKPRKLNNYLVWRMAVSYVQDLSWEYIHANREFYVDQTGRAEFLGTWRYCFNYVDAWMNEALGALFVKDHFADQNKPKAEEVVRYTKNALLKNLETTPWFDEPTRKLAIAKLTAMKDKMGYPDYMVDENQVDAIYQYLKINRTDYFQNLLNMNLYEKKEWNDLLKNGVSWDDWRFKAYDVIGQLHRVWNELIIPAGFLQFPLYDHLLPAYHNFAVLGGMAGHLTVHDIGEGDTDEVRLWVQSNDFCMATFRFEKMQNLRFLDDDLSLLELNATQFGAWYDINGKYGNWWSEATKTAYKKSKECTSNYYSNLTMGPYINPDTGSPEKIPVDGPRYGYEGISIGSGLKIAYQAYVQWVKDNGPEKTAPGFSLSNDQMFFLSFAQSKCYNRSPTALYRNAKRQSLPDDLVTNSILAQSDDFVKAFNCPVGSKMNAKTKCTLY